MTEVITSINNPIIKHIKSLYEKSKRDKLGQFFVEGYRIVKDALEHNAAFESAVVSESAASSDAVGLIAELKAKGIQIHIISDKLFKELSDTQTPQGILGVIKKAEYELENIFQDQNAFIVMLENLQDPGNMGTIIRTADAAGATGIIISKGCVDVYNPKVLRSTMGAIFHMPIIKSDDFSETIKKLKSKRFNVFAAHLNGSVSHFEVDMKSNTAIVIGNEANGISEDTARKCSLIKIPMPGKAESLNASAAAAILIYECVRQRIK